MGELCGYDNYNDVSSGDQHITNSKVKSYYKIVDIEQKGCFHVCMYAWMNEKFLSAVLVALWIVVWSGSVILSSILLIL